MVNPHKGKYTKYVRFKSEEQLKDLIDAINVNDNDEVLNLVNDIYRDGGFEL